VGQPVQVPNRCSGAQRGPVILLLALLPLAACGFDRRGGWYAAIKCRVTEETSDYREQPPGTLIQSDTFEGCLLGEVIVCPDEAGSDYDSIRCGEIQAGSVRRD